MKDATWGVVWVALAFLGGCDRLESASLGSVAPPSIAAPPTEEVSDGRIVGELRETAVAYSCADVEPEDKPALHHAARALLESVHLASPDVPAPAPALERAIDGALGTPLWVLSTRDRVMIQAAALRVSRSSSDVGRRARKLVRRVALDSATSSSIGSDPSPDLEPILGSSDAWIERRGPSCGPLGNHDSAFGGALAFRTLRSGSTRALVGQIVAFDTQGEPRVTPYVALLEMRSGMRADSPACVVALGGDGLEAVEHADLIPTPFIRPLSNQRVECGSCHTGKAAYDLADLPRERAFEFRFERRVTLLDLAKQLAVREGGREGGGIFRP